MRDEQPAPECETCGHCGCQVYATLMRHGMCDECAKLEECNDCGALSACTRWSPIYSGDVSLCDDCDREHPRRLGELDWSKLDVGY